MEFVQEAVGQALPTPNIFYDPVDSSDTPHSDADCNTTFAEKRKKIFNNKPSAKRKLPQSLTINVNYVYGNGLDISTTTTNTSTGTTLPTPTYTIEYPASNKENTQSSSITAINTTSPNLLNTTQTSDINITNLNTSNNSLPDSTINSTIDLTQNDGNNTTTTTECPVITYNFDWRTKTLQPAFDTSSIIESETIEPPPAPDQETITDTIPTVTSPAPPSAATSPKQADAKVINTLDKQPNYNRKFKTSKKLGSILKLNKKIQLIASSYRHKRHLQRRCEQLITTYSLHLDNILLKYKKQPLIQHYYRHFKALELYTGLLKGLKLFCLKNSDNMSQSTSNNSPSTLKRARNSNSNTEDDNSPSSARQVRKLNRQEENFRHMLLPDSPEETNRKDASKYLIYYGIKL